MTVRRAAPGPQVSTGRLRVDAARAIAKLREYQLADRAAWILEAIRAAVASEATAIWLSGDADDIWLSWDGPAWDAALLPRLFDELVSPEAAEELQHVRLLAAAVNSGLGMKPAYIDVYAITGGAAQRVRYTPDVLADHKDGFGEPKLREVVLEACKPPPHARGAMHVHLKRRASLEVLGYWLGEPPELPIVRDRCRDISVPLDLDGAVLHRETTTDLVRVPLGDGLDGFIAVTEPARATPKPQLEVAERGVILARYPLDLLGFEARTPVPVRVFVDAPRLPTNASRSQVREDIHPISTVKRRCPGLVEPVVSGLAAAVSDAGPVARHAALLLLAGNVAGHPASWHDLVPALRPLAKLPLLRTATGKPGTLETAWIDAVHTGARPLDEDLAPWLGDMLWLPKDDNARILLAGFPLDAFAMRLLVRQARRQRRAHRQFLAHAKRELRVETTIVPRIRVPLGVEVPGTCVPRDMFANMRGEICVYPTGKDATLIVLLDGRELERIELESDIPFDAVIEHSFARPGDRYRGVARDVVYDAITQAMQLGVVRAIEALATHLDDAEIADVGDRAYDRFLVRKALAIVHRHGFEWTSPLREAPAWLTVDGKAASLADLLASRTIGTVSEGVTLVPPKGRVILQAAGDELEDLRRVVGERVVSYQPAAGIVQRVSPVKLAAQISRVVDGVALHIREGDLVAAISVAGGSTLTMFHMGKRLAEVTYGDTYLRCAIAVDSDEITPNAAWSDVVLDAGLTGRSYVGWELALLQAITRAVIGDRPAELEGPAQIFLHDPNGEVLVKALVNHGPTTILGVDLTRRLAEAALFSLAGELGTVSAVEVGKRFPGAIPHVPDIADGVVEGFHPLLADARLARLVGALLGRSVMDGRPELERRRRERAFGTRLATHLQRPVEPVALAADVITAPVVGVVKRGVVGVSSGPFELRIFVDGRSFQTLTLPHPHPLQAAVEVAASHCDETFTAVRGEAIREISRDVIAAVPELLQALAARDPANLDRADVRALLAAWVAHGEPPTETRELLRSTSAFRSIQGPRASIADASPRLILSVAAWADPWLPPGESEPATPLDEPILFISGADDELHVIADAVQVYGVMDVTGEVVKLQARRRMARGLVPTPKATAVPPELKRDLKAFGDLGKRLGHGEVGLIGGARSTLLLHHEGQLKQQTELDVLPAVALAIEDPRGEHPPEALERIVHDLGLQLVEMLVVAGAEVPPEIRRSLARALLARSIPPMALGTLPLFARGDGTWLSWPELVAQAEKLGDVWALPSPPAPDALPLDPERFVIVLEPEVLALAVAHEHPIIDATQELALDVQARANRRRHVVEKLVLPDHHGVLTQVDLRDEARAGLTGIVAVLDPMFARKRGVLVHRSMQPLGRIDDVCRWPTISVIDDARIEPDRTWAAPKQDETWQAIAKQIRAASERALSTLGEVPAGALASIRVTNQVYADVDRLREAPRAAIRGALWITELPGAPVSITVHHEGGVLEFVPPRAMPINGWLAVAELDGQRLDLILTDLCRACHGKLVRKLIKNEDVDDDAAAAHVAHAIALGTVKPTEVAAVQFACFAPRPLSARALATMLRGVDPVPLAGDDSDGFVDDGSETARVVRTHLVGRIVAAQPRTKKQPSIPPRGPTIPPVSTQRPSRPQPAVPPPPATKPEPPHALQPLVDALSTRVAGLGVGSIGWSIDNVSDPMFRCGSRHVRIGASHPLLQRINTELSAETIHAEPAIDALAAHVVSLLNLAMTDVTDPVEQHAIGVLLVTQPSAGRPRSRRSS